MTLLAPLVGAIVSWLVTGWITETAHTRRWVDAAADGRRMHVTPVPRLGGVAVCLGALAALATAVASGVVEMAEVARHGRLVAGAGAGCLVLLGVGVRDDLVGVRPRTKLAAQALAGAAVCAGGVRVGSIALGEWSWHPGWLAPVLVVVWVVAVTNAVNLIDGLDGLATGIAVVALGTTLALALMLRVPDVAVIIAALLGALAGFLRYNFNPARIFLGDSGSLFVGYMLAVLSVMGSTKSSTAVLAIVPLFALALPLLDTLLAVVRRWLRGVSFATADGRHIHHRLLARGLTPRRAALVMYVAASALAGIALTVVLAPADKVTYITWGGVVASMALLVSGLRGLKYHEFSEVGALIAIAPTKVRRILRDRINAHDVAAALTTAESLAAVNAILEDCASLFDFAHMQVCGPAEVAARATELGIDFEHAWWAVFPLRHRNARVDPMALVVWCPTFGAGRPHGAERVAAILSPVVAARMDHAFALARPAPPAAPRFAEPGLLVEARV